MLVGGLPIHPVQGHLVPGAHLRQQLNTEEDGQAKRRLGLSVRTACCRQYVAGRRSLKSHRQPRHSPSPSGVRIAGSDSFSLSLQQQGPHSSLILQGSGLRGNDAKFQTESLPRSEPSETIDGRDDLLSEELHTASSLRIIHIAEHDLHLRLNGPELLAQVMQLIEHRVRVTNQRAPLG